MEIIRFSLHFYAIGVLQVLLDNIYRRDAKINRKKKIIMQARAKKNAFLSQKNAFFLKPDENC